AMAERLVWAAGHREELAAMAERARRIAEEELSFEATSRPLVEWAAEPSEAGDAHVRRRIRRPEDHMRSPAHLVPTGPDPDLPGPGPPADPRLVEHLAAASRAAEAPAPRGRLLRRIARRLVG
ncbi:MAG: hypothetical protein MI919_14905, partial [Holophagales bacterium]|nr:hypothetical protein [Holophagales bacterium]